MDYAIAKAKWGRSHPDFFDSRRSGQAKKKPKTGHQMMPAHVVEALSRPGGEAMWFKRFRQHDAACMGIYVDPTN